MFPTTKRFAALGMAVLAFAACEDRNATSPDAEVLGSQGSQEARGSEKINLNRGAVYTMSNAREGNVVVAFSRAPDGRLTRAGDFPTGGTGSGSFEDTANGLVLASTEVEASPNNLSGNGKFLFATNAGSNSITVFRVEKEGLRTVEVQESGGEKPVSVSIANGLLYVLHSGETNDDLIPENCTSGALPTITGFRVASDGSLSPIAGSTRTLSEDPFSGCAQVSFAPGGDVLVVSEREAEVLPGQTDNEMDDAGDEGVLVTFTVNADGTLGNKQIFDATGEGPFGFTFTRTGTLVLTEQQDGPAGPGRGTASTYAVGSDGTLTPTSGSVGNGGTDTCWFVVTNNGKLAFAASFFPDARISSYRVGSDGSLSLIQAVAADTNTGTADLALSRNGKFLYNINAFEGTISAFEVGNDGSLTQIQTIEAHAPSAMAARLGLAAS